MSDFVKTRDLFDCKNEYLSPLFEASEYPWEILPQIKDYIRKLLEKGLPGYTMLKDGVLIGENVKIYDYLTPVCLCIHYNICQAPFVGHVLKSAKTVLNYMF